jgi:hypothetical protein
MQLPIKSQRPRLGRLAILTSLVFLSVVDAPALSTGIPLQFNIDPATVRQREKDETAVLATIVLKVPSPSFFVCQIRSGDKNKVTFTDIVFKKGQLKGTAQGIIHWQRIMKDCEVKVSAFSVDAPGEKLWFTLAIKTKNQDQSVSGQKPWNSLQK